MAVSTLFSHSPLLSVPFVPLHSYHLLYRYAPPNNKFFISEQLSYHSVIFISTESCPKNYVFTIFSQIVPVNKRLCSLRNSAIHFELEWNSEYERCNMHEFFKLFRITKLYANYPKTQMKLTGMINCATDVSHTTNQGFQWYHSTYHLKFWTKSIHVLDPNLHPVKKNNLSPYFYIIRMGLLGPLYLLMGPIRDLYPFSNLLLCLMWNRYSDFPSHG